jgi:uncharacterized protein YegL
MENLEQREFYPPTIINASEPHMALVFLLDTSKSMSGKPIYDLNEGLKRFKTEVCKDKQTRDILDVAIIEFNSTHRVVQEFVPVEYMETVNFETAGTTVMSTPIEVALNMVDRRSKFYNSPGVGTVPYKPWIFIITDGYPDSDDDITAVTQRIKNMEAKGKVSFRSLGVSGCDFEILHKLSGPKVLELEGTDFTSFFDWVRKSMRSVSESSPGEKPKAIDVEGNVTVHRSTDNFD